MKVVIEPVGDKNSMAGLTKKILRAVENAGNGSAMDVKVDFLTTVRTWSSKPDFGIKHTADTGIWEISTDDEIYKYIDEGTRPHVIKARRATRLAFNASGFRPKTRAGWIGSSAGASANSDFTRPKSVNHPGNTARNFSEDIQEKWLKEWPRNLQRAIRAAVEYE